MAGKPVEGDEPGGVRPGGGVDIGRHRAWLVCALPQEPPGPCRMVYMKGTGFQGFILLFPFCSQGC